MGDRKLYPPASFTVSSIEKHVEHDVWHIVGVFTPTSIKTKYPDRRYRVRVVPDPRWENINEFAFLVDGIYETESIGSVSNKHIYGSGKFYVCRQTSGYKGSASDEDTRFLFDEIRPISKEEQDKRIAVCKEQREAVLKKLDSLVGSGKVVHLSLVKKSRPGSSLKLWESEQDGRAYLLYSGESYEKNDGSVHFFVAREEKKKMYLRRIFVGVMSGGWHAYCFSQYRSLEIVI